MNESRSIKQNLMSDTLPNFRNLGVTLRILLLGNGMATFAALLQASGWLDVAHQLMQIATLLTPVMLTTMLLLWAGQPWLARLPYGYGVLTVNLIVIVTALLTYRAGGELYRPAYGADYYFDLLRCLFLSASMCTLLLMYFRLRAQVLSNALLDARLQVLHARIRPHFLYNTINAVLGIVRTQPRQAETALEDMADLFRMAMSDEQDLVPLQREIQLSRQYLALEHLRMGDRLGVTWEIEGVADEVYIPAFVLQPLLENAVYHGIESRVEGGCIQVRIRRRGSELHIVVENPCAGAVLLHSGNKIALKNIRERLALLFDAEASYQVERGDNYYRVEITLPYTRTLT